MSSSSQIADDRGYSTRISFGFPLESHSCGQREKLEQKYLVGKDANRAKAESKWGEKMPRSERHVDKKSLSELERFVVILEVTMRCLSGSSGCLQSEGNG